MIESQIELCNGGLCIDESVTQVSCNEDSVGPDGLLPHPDSCRLFYYCVAPGWPAICRLCPAGLHFNPNKHVCDTVEDAGCEIDEPSD